MILIKAIWLCFVRVLEIIPTTLYLWLHSSEEHVEEFKNLYVSALIEAYQVFESGEFFYQEGLDRKIILNQVFRIRTIPIILKPKIRKEIYDQAIKLAYHKMDWKLKLDGKN